MLSFQRAPFEGDLSNWWMVVMLCLISIDAQQMPDWNRSFTAPTVQRGELTGGGGVKPSLIGNWKVISILVFWVSQGPNVLQLLMMSRWVKKTQPLCWAVNKQEQSVELNRKEKQVDVRPPVLLPAGTSFRGTSKLNANKVNMHTWHHCPLPGLIMIMDWDNSPRFTNMQVYITL